MKKQITSEQYETVQKQLEEYKGKYLRALADYQNLEKRVNQEREAQIKYASRKIIHELLVIFDTLEKVLEHNKNDEGLKLGINGFWGVLCGNGVKKIEVLGKRFDPHIMECTEVVESDKDDVVVKEVRPGYMVWDKVLRVTQVKVGKEISGKSEARNPKSETNSNDQNTNDQNN